jgi:hypothetical protein
MSLVWQIILLLFLCVLVYILYKTFYKKKDEGFQTSAQTVLVGTATCTATSSQIYDTHNEPSTTSTVKNIVFKFLLPPSINIQIDSPIQIWSLDSSGSASNLLLSGTIFAYNYPNIMINNSTSSTWTLTSGLECSSTSSSATITVNSTPSTTIQFTSENNPPCPNFSKSYGLYMNFCDIELNKMKSACITNAVAAQSAADTLGKETVAETNTYDMYETYNFNNLQEVLPTTVTQYDTSQELGEFDFGAPVPWDYENRMYNPADMLWGVIHPRCSSEIFKSAYNKKLFSSISPLQFDEITHTFTYKSPYIDVTIDESNQFLPALQLFDMSVNVVGSAFVDTKCEHLTNKLLLSSSYGRRISEVAAINLKVNAYNTAHYQDLVLRGVSNKNERRIIIQSSGQALMNHLQSIHSSRFSSGQMQALEGAFNDAHGNGLNSRRTDFDRLNDGYRAQAELSEKFKSIRATQSSSPGTTESADNAAARTNSNPERVNSATTQVNNARPSKPVTLNSELAHIRMTPLKVSRAPSIKITSALLNILKGGAKEAARFMASKAGSLIIKFAKALGALVEAESIIMAATVGIGSVIGGPAGAAIGGSIGLALEIILGLFVIACCTFVPAILGAYIPDDAVCPPGYTNLYKTIIDGCGGNEIAWLVISSIPVIGDGIGTFAPYLCSKYDANNLLMDVVIKKPPVFPDYYYDSSLSIYPDFQKDPLSGREGWFKDQRKYQKSGVPPVWVDFSDSRILDRMAQYYYKIAKRFATNNYDGTFTFDYISKFYGVIASTQTCCDVQCEIRRKTYYENTGIEQSDYILPVDPANQLTYHDRRFYFYVLEPYNSETESPSLFKMEKYIKSTDSYKKTYKNYVFLSTSTRNTYLSGTNAQLDLLMTDNINRYIVTGCTNQDGTAPNAYEVDEEGQYVGDAIVSVGGKSVTNLPASINSSTNMNYYPPAISFNDSFLDELINTTATVTSVTSLLISFSFTPSLANNFIATGSYFDSNGNTHTYTSDILNIKKGASNFDGTVTATSYGSVTVSYTGTSTLVSGDVCILKIKTRSNSSKVDLMPGQCAETMSKINKFNQNINVLTQGASQIHPSYALTIRSPTQVAWEVSNKFNSRYSTKIWKTNVDTSTKVMSQDAFNGQIISGTVLGYIGMRITWRGIPTGAFAAGLASTPFTPTRNSDGNLNPPSSLTGIIACIYEYSTKSLGTFVLNGRSITTQESTDPNNDSDLNLYYMYIDRGPTIPFSPGYTPYIDKSINLITQLDCVNRYAIRYAVNEFNKTNMYASKVLDIITDTTNSRCAYTFEAIDKGNREVTTQQGVINYSYNAYMAITNVPNDRITLVPNNTMSIYQIETDLTKYGTSGENYTYKTTKPSPTLDLTIRPNDFNLISTADLSTQPNTAPTGSTQFPSTYDETKTDTWSNNIDITRKDTKNLASKYTCATPLVYNHIFTQFNLKHGGNPIIRSIINTDTTPGVYYPTGGNKQPDETVICIYNTSVKVKDQYGAENLDTSFITMLLQKGSDPDLSPYDLVTDNYKGVYAYNKFPKYWIDIPPPLSRVKTLTLGGACDVSISSCSNMAVIGNIVGQFNTKFTDRKIMKVRKAYTPQISGANVCDFEVEMLHNLPNTSNTYIRKESIRVPIIANTPNCMWDMNTDDAPQIDSGASLTNSISVSWLPTPYVWGTSMLSNVTSIVTNAVTNFLSLDANNVLVKATTDMNNKVNDIANSLQSAQYLLGLNCQPSTPIMTCRSPEIIQKMINRYYVDNFPINQYGDSQRYITTIRKVGSDLNNHCQVEFIETVSTFLDYTKAPIFSSDPRAFESQYNPTSYLRQYQFKITANNDCTFDAKSVRPNVLDGTLYKLDLGSSSIRSFRSANSVLSGGELGNLSFPASTNVRVPCEDITNILPAVKSWYEAASYYPDRNKHNTLTNVSFSFNPAANVCEYSISSMVWESNQYMGGGYTRSLGQVYLKATWDTNYSYNNGISNNYSPDSVEMFNPNTITPSVNGPNMVYVDSTGTTVALPYIYGVREIARVDSERVKKIVGYPGNV